MDGPREYVVALCDTGEGFDEILFVHKDRPASMRGRINLPGGKIEPEDDGPVVAAIRELAEETGIRAKSGHHYGDIIVESDMAFAQPAIIRCVVCDVYGAAQIRPREGETEIAEWIPWRKALGSGLLMPNLRIVIPLMMAGVRGWVIDDRTPSAGKSHHVVSVQVPTYYRLG